MASTDKCNSCKFFKNTDKTCHYENPVPMVALRLQGEVASVVPDHAAWAVVEPNDWCGRYLNGPYKG